MHSLRPCLIFCLLTALCLAIGCSGSTEIIIPKDELTAEQIEKIRAEDKAIEDEESQGSNKKKK
ncbi:MAG: hypothetical protein LW724_16435 [Planctomycetaceae bacterium]|jgi:hypothetical protein|nr:hypothetical protein [Planctomycetaceae bacterium]